MAVNDCWADFCRDATDEDTAFRKKMDEYLAECKVRGRRKRAPSGKYENSDSFIKFLRQRTSRLNYGVEVPGLGVRPELSIDKLIARYNGRRCGRFGAALRNDQFHDHFEARQNYYFWADHRTSTPEIIVNIDFDGGEDHVGGHADQTDAVWRFARLVRDRLLPGLYLEPSTHGKGVHGYFVLLKRGIKAGAVQKVLKRFDLYLKRLAASVNADIACVEIKGKPPSIRYDEKGNIIHITFGQWAKLPRDRGVLDTCKVKLADLARLDPEEIEVKDQAEPEKVVPIKAATRPTGSFDSRVIRQETLDRLPDLEKYAECLLRQWTGASSFKADRWTVTAIDLAQFFALMLCIKPKPDDALAVRAIGRLWEEVYRAGDFERPWNHHRCKAIRDLLSQHGHIDWTDHRFQNLPDGKGRCCRWRLSLMLKSALASLKGETTVVDTAVRLPDGPHEFLTPKWFNFALDRQLRWWTEAEDRVEALFAA